MNKNKAMLFDVNDMPPNMLEEMEKKAEIDLGPDAQTWMSSIRSAFEQQHPELIRAGGKPSINFNKRDPMRGDATGSITITVNSTYMVFPLIIRDAKLSPFDCVYVNKHWHYADRELMIDIVNSYNLFLGETAPPKDDLYANVRWNRFDYRPSLSGYLTLGKTAGLEAYCREKVAEFIDKHPGVYANATPKFKEYVQKIASRQDTNILDKRPRSSEFDLMSIRKLDINRYGIKMACKGCNGFVEMEASSNELRKLVAPFTKNAEKVLDEVDSHPTDSLVIDRTSFIGEPTADPIHPMNKPGMIHTYGVYRILREDGGQEVGTVFPMINWNFSATDKLLFLGPQSWAVQREMAGHPSSEIIVVPNGSLDISAEGCFVYDKNGKAFATPPFKILSAMTCTDGTSLKIMDLTDMQAMHVVLVPGLRGIMEITPDDHAEIYEVGMLNLYIPAEMKFTPLPPSRTKIIPDPTSVVKISSEMSNMRLHPFQAVLTRSDISSEFTLDRGGYPFGEYTDRFQKLAGFRRYPGALEHLGEADAGMALLAMGCPDPEPFLKEASETGCSIVGLPDTSEFDSPRRMRAESVLFDFMEKSSSAWDELYRSVNDHMDKDTILKIAAGVEDEVALDKLFNIAFLGKDTISYFASHMDLLNDAEELLTKMLLASRLSNIGIEETSIKQTLEGLSDIQEGFKGLALKNG